MSDEAEYDAKNYAIEEGVIRNSINAAFKPIHVCTFYTDIVY